MPTTTHRAPASTGTAWPPINPEILEFHRRLPGYCVTPLVSCPSIAARVGAGEVWVKDETRRLDLPAFKVLGASWAAYCAVERRFGPLAPWNTVTELAAQVSRMRGLTFVAATDGNHGRALARTASWFGCAAEILVPAGTAQARIRAIESEGAVVREIDGSYDDAVAEAGATSSDTRLVIADTGSDETARDVIDGYSTLIREIADQSASRLAPDVVVIQSGVGALAAGVIRTLPSICAAAPRVVLVEPVTAACVQASLTSDVPTPAPGPHRSVMVGLNCGEISPVAWETLRSRVDATIAIGDEPVAEAVQLLHAAGIEVGETGAASLAGMLHVKDSGSGNDKESVGIGPHSRVLLIATEGVTDPALTAELLAVRP
jgi:diaminopropionate ammonia-lyase